MQSRSSKEIHVKNRTTLPNKTHSPPKQRFLSVRFWGIVNSAFVSIHRIFDLFGIWLFDVRFRLIIHITQKCITFVSCIHASALQICRAFSRRTNRKKKKPRIILTIYEFQCNCKSNIFAVIVFYQCIFFSHFDFVRAKWSQLVEIDNQLQIRR